MERRAVDVDVDLGSTSGEFGYGPVGEPDVLADRQTDANTGDLVKSVCSGSGFERALFVEHVVIREDPLVIHAVHSTTGTDRRGVEENVATSRRVDGTTSIDETDNSCTIGGLRRDVFEHRPVVAHEAGLQNEVLGRITSDRQFAEHHDVASARRRFAVRLENSITVAGQVAHQRVELSQTDSQRGHGAKANGRGGRPIRGIRP